MNRKDFAVHSVFARAFRMFVLCALLGAMVPIGVVPASALTAEIWYVNATSGSDGNDGLSAATAFETITHALDVADFMDTVSVAQGKYDTANGETFPLMVDQESLLGVDGANLTTIDAGSGTQQILIYNNPDAGTQLSGFTFVGGGSNGGAVWVNQNLDVPSSDPVVISGNVFNNSSAAGKGALLINAPTAGTYVDVSDNTFSNNSAPSAEGGAALVMKGYVGGTIANNVFSNNTSTSGGALYIYQHANLPIALRGNEFANNASTSAGGAVWWAADAIYPITHTIADNVFRDNTAGAHGGALSLGGLFFDIERNQGLRNTAPSGFGGFAMLSANCAVNAQNNALIENDSTGGSAWYLMGGVVFNENSDTVASVASTAEGMCADALATANITNSIYWNPGATTEFFRADSISYTCSKHTNINDPIYENTVGAGMIYSDPLFVNLAGGSPDIAPASPCIDTANTATAPTDDFYLASRPKDGDANGTAIPDMGCVEYEYPNTPPALDPIGSKSVNELSLLTFTATATDDDGDALTYSLGAGAPEGAAITSAGVFTWTPTEAQGPGSYPITIRVSDGVANDSETITVTVAEVPDIPAGLTVTPVAGAGRIETAIEASKLGFTPGSSEYVIIATALAFPDALGGSALAGALDAPILLTYPTVLPDAVKAEIARLGATKVIVLGGTGAVNDAVYTALDDLDGVTAERIWGDTRYSTAEKVAKRTIAEMGGAWDGTAFVATGASFPDALGASPLAAAKGWPIYLLAPQTSTHDALVATMKADEVTSVLALGGTGAVPATFETKLNAAFTDAKVDRLAGADRYTTALEVARHGVASAGLSWDHLAIATGDNFPDALAGGALQGSDGSVMLLAAPTGLNAEVRAELVARKAGITEVRFLGGTGAVPQTIRDAVVDALE